jgi:hypothetical protein
MLESKEIPEQKFKVGDSVTYLSKKEAAALKTRDDRKQTYYYGGSDFGGSIGIISNYYQYNEGAKCWKIYVSTPDGSSYGMLECEFLEYSNSPISEYYEIY